MGDLTYDEWLSLQLSLHNSHVQAWETYKYNQNPQDFWGTDEYDY